MGTVITFKASVQARVPGGPVAEAIAGKLMKNTRHLGRCFIGTTLEVVFKVHLIQLRAGRNRSQLFALCRWQRMIGRDLFVQELRGGRDGQQNYREKREDAFHFGQC